MAGLGEATDIVHSFGQTIHGDFGLAPQCAHQSGGNGAGLAP